MIIPEFLVPFGPLHIVFLHLPIGGLVALWFVLFALSEDGRTHSSSAIGLLHLFLVFSTAITIVLGLSYEVHGQFEEELDLHVLWGFIFGGAVLVNYIIYRVHRARAAKFTKLLYVLSLAFATVAMTITGHQGGELVHGKGFVTKPFQATEVTQFEVSEGKSVAEVVEVEPVAVELQTAVSGELVSVTASEEIMADDPMIGSAMNFPGMGEIAMSGVDHMPAALKPMVSELSDDSIELYEAAQLVFKNHCYNCHGATKQKGDLRLDLEGTAFAGGDSGAVSIIPNDAAASLVIERIRLPRSHDDAMPPEKKQRVTPAGLEAVIAWIQAGAIWPDARALAQRTSDYVEIVNEAVEQLIEKLNVTGAKAEYNSWDDPRIRVDLSFVDADQLETAIIRLESVGDQVFWLDAGGLVLPATFYDQLSKLGNLERLYLNGSTVSDRDLKSISSLAKLSYLNLFNTEVTDQGLETVQSLLNLKQVFLGHTAVSKAGANRLTAAREDLSVIH